ncbi:MAG TPA: HAD family hydrolase [Candidatus Sulfotelmatobacter sp.]|jgi:FMN phosphatase YigB (HAD superfamily)|nr:HAD family hydrolase [Candidatus Sulfotelmatobacter sp.]
MKKSDIIVLLDLDDTLFNTEKFINSDLTVLELYDEVKDALIKLSQIATIGLLSQGETAFQEKKLRETNIDHYFLEENKHIVAYKLRIMEQVLSKYRGAKVYFIEDRLENLEAAKTADPSVFTVWMKRGRYAKVQSSHSKFIPDAVVTNMHEVILLIN